MNPLTNVRFLLFAEYARIVRSGTLPKRTPERHRRSYQRRRIIRRIPNYRPSCIATTALAAGASNSALNQYTTGTQTPNANELVLGFIFNTKSSNPDAVNSVVGNSLTYVAITTKTCTNGSTVFGRITIFRAMGASPTPGTVVIDFNGVSQAGCLWRFFSFSGVDTSGTNGSGAVSATNVVTNGAASGTAVTATLAALASANNACVYGAACESSGVSFTDNNSFTALGGGNLSNLTTNRGWKVNATAVSLTLGVSNGWGIIAFEIIAANVIVPDHVTMKPGLRRGLKRGLANALEMIKHRELIPVGSALPQGG